MSDKTDTPAIDWPLRRRLAMVIVGYLPFLHLGLAIVTTVLTVQWRGWAWGSTSAMLMLYLLPPLGCRIGLLIFGPGIGRHSVKSAAFLRWWLAAQWQVIFNRLPFLEELLRLVPGLYSFWLRLWGAEVGSLVYWSPGVVVLDRSYIRIGARVVFGAGVRLNPHVIVPGKGRDAQLWLAPVTLEHDSLIGGYCLVTAGATVPAGLSVPAGRTIRPFSTWQDNEPLTAASDPSLP